MIKRKISIIMVLALIHNVFHPTTAKFLEENIDVPINQKNLGKEALEKLNQCIILFTNASNTLNEEARNIFLNAAVTLYKELLKMENDLPSTISNAIKDKMQALGSALLEMLGLKKLTDLERNNQQYPLSTL